MRAAVQGQVFLPIELKGGRHDRPAQAGHGLRVAAHVEHPGILEQGNVQIDRFFGLVVEGDEGCDFGHGASPIMELDVRCVYLYDEHWGAKSTRGDKSNMFAQSGEISRKFMGRRAYEVCPSPHEFPENYCYG